MRNRKTHGRHGNEFLGGKRILASGLSRGDITDDACDLLIVHEVKSHRRLPAWIADVLHL